MMISDDLVQTEEEFENLESGWNDLLEKSGSPSIFLTWEWMFTWWSYYSRQRKLFLVLFREGKNLVGIAPLLQEEEGKRGIKVQTLRFLGSDGPACSEFLDLIIAPGYEIKIHQRMAGFLQEYRFAWDRVILNPVSADGSHVHHLHRLASRAYLAESEKSLMCPYVKLPADWNQFLASLSPNFRQQIRACVRKLESRKDIRYVADAQNRYPIPLLVDTLGELNRQRMEQKGIDSTLKDSSFRRFLSDALERFQSRGWLGCSLLQKEQQILAVIFTFRYAKKIWYYQAGFLPEYASFRPGTLLFARTIQEAIEKGFLEYDFLRGEEQYKYRWGSTNRPAVTFHLYNRKFFPHMICYFRRARTWLSEALHQGSSGHYNP